LEKIYRDFNTCKGLSKRFLSPNGRDTIFNYTFTKENALRKIRERERERERENECPLPCF
jgi:hypothetical protein